jgi:hypothetical protein
MTCAWLFVVGLERIAIILFAAPDLLLRIRTRSVRAA